MNSGLIVPEFCYHPPLGEAGAIDFVFLESVVCSLWQDQMFEIIPQPPHNKFLRQ
jgi:hypothetical protein